MEMNGEERIAAPRQVVWEALNDPDVLRECIPGCESLEKSSDTEMSAAVKIKIGPVSARFTGDVTLENINAPESYTISGEGKGGIAGFAKGGADVKLVEDGAETVLTYDVKAQVGGKLAQLGSRLIDSTSKKLAGQFSRSSTRWSAPRPRAPETVAAVYSATLLPDLLPLFGHDLVQVGSCWQERDFRRICTDTGSGSVALVGCGQGCGDLLGLGLLAVRFGVPLDRFAGLHPRLLAVLALLEPGCQRSEDHAGDQGKKQKHEERQGDRKQRVGGIERIERQRHGLPVGHRQHDENNAQRHQDGQCDDALDHVLILSCLCSMRQARMSVQAENRPAATLQIGPHPGWRKLSPCLPD
jgi:carbon monoxide dehydrogenase subunit G